MSQSYSAPPYVPGAQDVPPPAPQQVTVQAPTVRVMRLYKPCMHVLPTLPIISEELSKQRNVDFAISPFLLLPDSFGDIYVGETFSAYIAVVNGNQDMSLTQVSLSVRLQTANSTHDLVDCNPQPGEHPGTTKLLNPNESVDVVVKHALTELGTHTLRVSVQYFSRYLTEPKTLRKFYRFNVLQPLQITSVGHDMGSRFIVQSVVTNTTKSPVFIEDVSQNFRAQ
jgi:trafficking protein particle complex subunit 13